MAAQNNVTIFSLLPHSSHEMQPLGRTFMSPPKAYYSENVRMWLRENQRPVSSYDVIDLFGSTYVNCQTTEIAINGFRCTGLYPVDRNIFQDSDFIAASQEVEYRTEHQGGTVEISASVLVASQHEEPRVVTSIFALPQMVEQPLPSSISVAPLDIIPVPTIRKRISTRGRKATSPAVITSPCKQTLVLSSGKSKRRKCQPDKGRGNYKRGGAASAGTGRRGRGHFDLDICIPQGRPPTEDDADSMFCGQKFLVDCNQEAWIQCALCSLWVLEECMGNDRDIYVCDFCQLCDTKTERGGAVVAHWTRVREDSGSITGLDVLIYGFPWFAEITPGDCCSGSLTKAMTDSFPFLTHSLFPLAAQTGLYNVPSCLGHVEWDRGLGIVLASTVDESHEDHLKYVSTRHHAETVPLLPVEGIIAEQPIHSSRRSFHDTTLRICTRRCCGRRGSLTNSTRARILAAVIRFPLVRVYTPGVTFALSSNVDAVLPATIALSVR
ncbi:hypothetical protein PR048_031783 [Dryococelus australis]|uniref:Uncharacterized protein n=1 Tax=Dryococelus australis TaxID=614101 RepID=A0ABQ9GA90_9NEOP|nr:hypothetical protein PR048_031783 [Dryococelus australis]